MNEKDNAQVPKGTEISYFVGVGASAGGLEALELLFSNMPADTGMAFIVIQHLSPDYKSLMVELLSKKTEMIVKRAEDGMIVEPNTVYLIPPKKNLKIFHSKLLLSESDHSKGINLPIDVFLRSLAEDQAEKSIGIILSGTGSDGVRGIRAIKEAGGMVMVQSEESAKFDGMPRAAISTGLTDFVLTPEQMPEKLQSFAKHPFAPKQERPPAILSDEDGMTRIFALLRERSKVDFTYYKPSTIVRRIERRMTVNQINDLKEYVKYLEQHSVEITSLYKELLIGVTNFFRDKEVFDELLENHMPKIFENAENREIRFWIAGCSTGEEAYSLAILSRECMEIIGKRYDVKIFATDIDKDAILRASNGIYPDSISADLSPKILTKYFYRKNEFYQIDRTIREMVVFAQHNLIKDPPFTNINLLSCRNLLIYLQPILQKRAMELMNFSLKSQGILLLGTSETTGEMSDLFEPLHMKYKIYKSRGRKKHINENIELPFINDGKLNQYRAKYFSGTQILRVHEEERLLERLVQGLATEFVKLGIVVNSQMEVLHILGEPEGFLKVTAGKLMNDISKMVIKDLSIPIATGLQNLFKTGIEVRYTNIKITGSNNTKIIQLRLKLLPTKKTQEPLAIIFIEEVSDVPNELVTKDGMVFDLSRETEQRVHDLEQELQFNRENLQATIEELETSNEELQATNEELLASNEELQSTNEELQSVNEELHTVNSEYQTKIIELTEANNDIDNLISSTRIGMLFLDENLEIRKFSPEAKKLFKIIESDIGRPIRHVIHTIKNFDLYEIINKVEKSGIGIENEIVNDENNWFYLKIFPYQVGTKTVSGISLIFIDINHLKETTKQLQESNTRISSFLRAAPIGVGIVINNKFDEINDKLCDLLDYSKDDLIGKSVRSFYQTDSEYKLVEKSNNHQINKYGTSVIETHWRKKDGSYIPILLTSAPLKQNKSEEGLTVTVQDLTIKINALENLKSTEERYKVLFNTMNYGIVYQNTKGEIISSNTKAQEILGLSVDELSGRTSMDIRWRAIRVDGTDFPGSEHPAMVSLKTGVSVKGVIMGIINPIQNKLRWIKINSIPLFNENDSKPYQVFSSFEDITQIIISETELMKSQERLDIASELSGSAWWEWDVEKDIVFASPLKGALIGYEYNELKTNLEFWTSKIHPDDYDFTMTAMMDYLYGKSSIYEVEYRLKSKHNSWVLLKDTGKIVERNKDGKPLRLIGLVKKMNINN